MANPTLYGVSTTRIFCRFGCPSRPPKPENVIYFLSSSEAVLQGFRPCKRCRPDQEKSPTEAFAAFVCHQLLEMGRAWSRTYSAPLPGRRRLGAKPRIYFCIAHHQPTPTGPQRLSDTIPGFMGLRTKECCLASSHTDWTAHLHRRRHRTR